MYLAYSSCTTWFIWVIFPPLHSFSQWTWFRSQWELISNLCSVGIMSRALEPHRNTHIPCVFVNLLHKILSYNIYGSKHQQFQITNQELIFNNMLDSRSFTSFCSWAFGLFRGTPSCWKLSRFVFCQITRCQGQKTVFLPQIERRWEQRTVTEESEAWGECSEQHWKYSAWLITGERVILTHHTVRVNAAKFQVTCQ